jgi:hypothetical protein
VISPLVYIFAAAAGVVALLFIASALLTYRHASTRSKRASDLRDYLAAGGPASREVGSKDVADAHKRRARVVHVTIGDLIRDESLAVAAAEGASAAAEARWTPVVRPFYRIDRTESGQYLVEVRPPEGPAIKARLETEAEARAWAEDTLWKFTAPGESGPDDSQEPR